MTLILFCTDKEGPIRTFVFKTHSTFSFLQMSRSVKGNMFSQNGESEKMKSPVFVFKPRPLCSPPPLTPVSSYKAKPPLVNSNTPSLTPFARLTTVNGNTKKTLEMNHPVPTKPLTELKLGSLLSGSCKQAVSNMAWKNNNSDANLFRVIQPCDEMQTLEHGHSGMVETQQMDGDNGKAMLGHVDGNKLPPMSVLAGTSGKGGAMTRYTDRWLWPPQPNGDTLPMVWNRCFSLLRHFVLWKDLFAPSGFRCAWTPACEAGTCLPLSVLPKRESVEVESSTTTDDVLLLSLNSQDLLLYLLFSWIRLLSYVFS